MKIPSLNSRNKYWNKRFEKGEIYSLQPSSIMKSLVNYINDSKKILVIGGGYGRNAVFLSKKGFDVTSIDISHKAISIGKSVYSGVLNLKFKKMDLFDLHFREKFSAVVAIYIMSLFTEDELLKIFKQIHNIISKGGKFCANFLSVDDDEFGMGKNLGNNLFLYNDGQLVKFYKKYEIKTLLNKHGFIIDEMLKVEEQRYIDILNKKIKSRSWLVLSQIGF